MSRLKRVWLALALALMLPAAPFAGAWAQQVVRPTGEPIVIDVEKGTLIRLDRNVDTVFVADPDIADVKVKSPRLIYLYAKAPGETSLYAVDAEQHVLLSRPVLVKRDVARLQLALSKLLPDDSVDVKAVDTSLVLTGDVDSSVDAEEARRIARPFVGDDKELINRIKIDAPNQVNLRVRVVEIQRNVIKELGINWDAISHVGAFAFGIATGNPVIGSLGLLGSGTDASSLSQIPSAPLTALAPSVGLAGGVPGAFVGGAVAGGYMTRNIGIGGVPTNSIISGYNTNRIGINDVIDALDQNGLATVLAEPNLTAMTGETASFLAGGEFPIIVPQTQGQVTIEFKQFGVALAFTPVVLSSGRISLRVRPEVSQLSTTGAVQIQGYTIPALTTRRAETTVELGSGQTFAIGGLLQNNIVDTLNKVPGLGEVPVLGALFRSDQFQRNETELVILVTPYLVRPVSDHELASPLDGYVPPNDRDRVLRGRNTRPTMPEAGNAPLGPSGNSLIGPSGFILN
ncbi:MAG TPA: type II and III secretion system protein family protein [Alphaproteobacteria bacterium]|nr:type II and III secretion system protein family protein [Alphaproteobacteria bacterium]